MTTQSSVLGDFLYLIIKTLVMILSSKKTVQKSDFNLDSLRSGKLWTYRPTQ
jgi:hypothetical protein